MLTLFLLFSEAPLSREARVVPGSGAAGTGNGQRSRLEMYRAIVRGGKATRQVSMTAVAKNWAVILGSGRDWRWGTCLALVLKPIGLIVSV